MGAVETKSCNPLFPKLRPLKKAFQICGLADKYPRVFFYVWKGKFLVLVTAKAIVSVVLIDLKSFKCITTYTVDISGLGLINHDCICIQQNQLVLTDYQRRIALVHLLTGKRFLTITHIETDQFDMTYKMMKLDDCRFVCMSKYFQHIDCFMVIPRGSQGKECIRLPDKQEISDVYCHQERFIIVLGCRVVERNFLYVYDFDKRFWIMRVASPFSYIYRSILSSQISNRFIIFASKCYGGKHKIMLWESINEQSMRQRTVVDIREAPSDILNFKLAKADKYMLYTTLGEDFLHNWLSFEFPDDCHTQRLSNPHVISTWYEIHKDFLITLSYPYLKFYMIC